MTETNISTLRDILYNLGRKITPDFVWEWFFRYYSAGISNAINEPADILTNYDALFTMAASFLAHQYETKKYSKIIKDLDTPDYIYYVVGDTHGSFDEVYQIINYFVQIFQVRSDVKVIFLGDIVDRNPYDLQNLAFIVAFWILFPDNVFIVRGNHEDASVCSRYGFSEHLYQKAGSKDVFNPVWNLIIDFFSRLPLGFLFQSGSKRCVIFHGGFPFNEEHFKVWQLEEAEKYLNCFQKEHFDMDPLSQSILWADPDPTLSSGVAPTPQSGRPRFSEDAFLSFMNQNGINCMIRGHSKWDEGYKLFFDNRLISIFSTSTYDGQHIGDAKFLRLTPDITLPEIEDEESGKGKGILSINQSFLQAQLKKYYNVNCEM